MTLASVRKAVATGLVGVAAIAGGAVTVGLISGQGAAWIAFAVICVQAVSHLIATYATPNGKTLGERVVQLERWAGPDLDKVLDAVQESPAPASVKAGASKVQEVVDKMAGVAAAAPWPPADGQAP